jgi:hypothetical protein
MVLVRSRTCRVDVTLHRVSSSPAGSLLAPTPARRPCRCRDRADRLRLQPHLGTNRGRDCSLCNLRLRRAIHGRHSSVADGRAAHRHSHSLPALLVFLTARALTKGRRSRQQPPRAPTIFLMGHYRPAFLRRGGRHRAHCRIILRSKFM